MFARRLIGGALVASIAACSKAESSMPMPTTPQGDQDSGFSPADSRPTLVVTPDDLLSDVGSSPIRVALGGIVSAETLASIASATRLRTYPELGAVPIGTTTHLADPYPTGPVAKDSSYAPGDYENYVVIVPKQSLDSAQWYVLTVDSLPPTVRPTTTSPLSKEPAKYGTRFRVGSGPIIRQVEVHADGSALVAFSEGVSIDVKTLPSFLGTKNPDSSACTYAPPGGPPPPPTQGAASFKCDPSIATAMRLRVDLLGGLSAPSSQPLAWIDTSASSSATLTKTTGTFVVASFPGSCGKGCFYWRP